MNQERTKNHRVFILKERPKEYSLTSQQKKFRQVIKECGIEKGITRELLIDKMINCIPKAWEKIKGAEKPPL